MSEAIASIEQLEAVNRVDDVALLLEAKLIWGGDTIGVRHLRPARAEVRVRDLELDVPSSEELLIASRDVTGELALRLPNGAIVPAGCRMKLRMGRTTLQLTLVADDAKAPPRALPDGRVALGIVAAAALHLVLLGLVAHGRASEGAVESAAREDMRRMMVAAEERALGELPATPEPPRDEKPGAIASRPDPAIAGNPSKTSDREARLRITRGDDHHGMPARPVTREEVATFGILGILTGDESGTRAGNSAFAAESGPSAMGNIFGQTIHDAAGLGGLGLTGPGEGGGGKGAGVSLGNIGTIGRAEGTGVGQGFGNGHCGPCVGGSHQTRSPTLVVGDYQVNGRLPPEAIQRVVRQSFGRLRGCYTHGLEQHPDLEGRIAVKFVIDRDGNVALASAAERTLDDASVAACVVKAYEAMTFPKPVGGIVTVVYPVVFTRTSP